MNFTDFYTRPETHDDAKAIIAFAKELGFSSVCVVMKDADKLKKEIKGIEILSGIEVTNLKKLNNTKADLIFAKSKDMDFNRKVCETPEIDVLLDPYDTSSCLFNQVMARLCRDNNIAVGLSFNQITISSKLTRSNLLKSIIELSDIMRKYNVPFRLISGAYNKFDMRSPSELISFGRILGFEDPKIKFSLTI